MSPISPITRVNLPLIFYASIPTSLIAPLCWMLAIQRLGAARTALTTNLLPVVVALLAWATQNSLRADIVSFRYPTLVGWNQQRLHANIHCGSFSAFNLIFSQRFVMVWSFFKSFFGANESESAKSDIKAAVTEGLDIDAAISAHQKWKMRLNDYLQGRSSEDLRPEVICFDNRCDLGKWIYSTGTRKLGRFPGFTALKEQHKMFHFTASNVVSLAQAGKEQEAKRMLLTVYESRSNSVIQALQQLQELAKNSHTY